jgi:ribosomal protein L37AE/L43A
VTSWDGQSEQQMHLAFHDAAKKIPVEIVLKVECPLCQKKVPEREIKQSLWGFCNTCEGEMIAESMG